MSPHIACNVLGSMRHRSLSEGDTLADANNQALMRHPGIRVVIRRTFFELELGDIAPHRTTCNANKGSDFNAWSGVTTPSLGEMSANSGSESSCSDLVGSGIEGYDAVRWFLRMGCISRWFLVVGVLE